MRDIKSFRETFVVKIFNKNFKIKVGSGFFFFPFFFFFQNRNKESLSDNGVATKQEIHHVVSPR